MEKNVSVIITNYNTAPVLAGCLENLVNLNESLEIIVVDNASTDGSIERVKTGFPDVTLLALPDNKGLAHGNNVGAKLAKGKFLLFLGSDAFPKKGTITGLSRFLEENRKVGVVTPKLLLRNGRMDKDCHRGFPTVWASLTHFSGLDRLFKGSKLFDRYFLGYRDLENVHEIDLCISHFLMVRRETFESVAGFDENFFVYGEDVDFCFRAKENGWKVMYNPGFTAGHYKGVSVGVRKETRDISKATPETKRKMAKESAEAMLKFYNKHYLKTHPKIVNALVIGMIHLKGIIREMGYNIIRK